MSAFLKLALTDHACNKIYFIYSNIRKRTGIGSLLACLYTLAYMLVLLFFRLESRAWQKLRFQYGLSFSHLTSRAYRFADPVRYLFQALWVFFIKPRNLPRQGVVSNKSGYISYYNKAKSKLDAAVNHVISNLNSNYSKKVQVVAGNIGRTGFFLLVLCALILSAMLITQPFNVFAQAVFVLLLWLAALVVRRVPGHFATLMLIALSVTVSARYIWWRYTATLNWNNNLDLTFGLLLLAAETYSWVVLLMGYVQTAWPLRRKPAPLPEDTGQWPSVDLMIPTYNEGLDVVKPVVFAALGMDWPADKLRIHLLDDGKRNAFRDFAAEVGINYITRPDNSNAKAGNLNNALKHTDGELVALFDCDHIPTRAFLQLTVGWFLKNKKMALVQTPHHFFSPDPFERNFGHFGTSPNENMLFYGLVQDGNDLWNSSFFCGSCAVLKRSALEEIGGFAVETVTEDAHTALRLHRHGYDSAYLRIPLAAGLATESLSAHVGQRIRWARGMVQIFRMDNPLLGRGLSFFQRICYANAMLHFLSGLPRIIYLLAPLAFLIGHSYIIYAPGLLIALYVLPHMAHASITSSRMYGPYRRSFFSEIYETVLSWYTARPTFVALFAPKKGRFNVTEKGGLIKKNYFDWTISLPYLLLIGLNFIGAGFGVWRLFNGPANEITTVLITMAWVIANLIILGGALAVASETRQVRITHRVNALLPCRLSFSNGQVYAGYLLDYSEGGVGMRIEGELDKNHQTGDPVTVVLNRGDRHFTFAGVLVRNSVASLGIRFEPMSHQQHIDFVQCTFARADAWLRAQSSFTLDKPLTGLKDAILIGLSGYKRLAEYMIFPFNKVAFGLAQLMTWFVSFVPKTPKKILEK